MAFPENNDLSRAIEALSIFDVWAKAYQAGVVLTAPPPQHRDGLVPSPFREDGKRGSFSICHSGRGYKDFGGTGASGNAWKFHALCWPNMEKGERAKELIEWSGITVTAPPKPAASPAPGSPAAAAAVIDPLLARAAKAIAKKDRAKDLENAAYEAREKLLRPAAPKKVEPMAACVREAYAEGMAHMRAEPKRITALAAERSWPEAWARELLGRELVSYPWERGARPGERWAGRQKAFAVQIPRPRGPGKIGLETVGYHQRFYTPARGTEAEKKGWLYVPSVPTSGVCRSDLEHGIVDWAATTLDRTREQILVERPKFVPPLPFVLGEIGVAPRLVVFLEGQWDAATFFGACGWFFDDELADPLPAEGCLVFGVRGAQGMDALLSYWGELFGKWKPRAWAIADNDAAGGTWREAPPAKPGEARPPSFADKLAAVGCREPLVSWLKPGAWGKDFNDYYRARAKASAPIGPAQMRAWMLKLGLISPSGNWT